MNVFLGILLLSQIAPIIGASFAIAYGGELSDLWIGYKVGMGFNVVLVIILGCSAGAYYFLSL